MREWTGDGKVSYSVLKVQNVSILLNEYKANPNKWLLTWDVYGFDFSIIKTNIWKIFLEEWDSIPETPFRLSLTTHLRRKIYWISALLSSISKRTIATFSSVSSSSQITSSRFVLVSDVANQALCPPHSTKSVVWDIWFSFVWRIFIYPSL